MDQKRAVIIVVMAILSSSSVASATPAVAGLITPPFTPTSCPGMENKGDMVAFLGSMWNNGAFCGKTLTVKCTDEPHRCKSFSPIDLIVVGECPHCDNGVDLKLSSVAFELISYRLNRRAEVDYVLHGDSNTV